MSSEFSVSTVATPRARVRIDRERFLPDTSHRSVLLDCIRTVAIVLVLVFHVAAEYGGSDLDAVARFFLRYGFLGVDIFFPLSGFLITRFLLTSTRPDRIKAFFLRRFFRIVPLYFVAVTTYFVASKVMRFELEILDQIWVNYLFLTGWFIFLEGRETVPYTITWSLSVEEFAYVLFGLVSWVTRRHFVAFLIVCSIVPMLLRLHFNMEGHADIYFFPLTRLDSIAMGGLVALLLPRVRHMAAILAGLTLAVYGIATLHPLLHQTLLFTWITLGTCFFIALFETTLRGVSNRFLSAMALIGFYSYFIYLFHYFNIYFVLELSEALGFGQPPFWPTVIVCLALSTGEAILSYGIFEGPLMRYGRRLERQQPA